MKLFLPVLFITGFLTSISQAATHFHCESSEFPKGIGSSLEFDIGDDGEATSQANLKFHDANASWPIGTQGWYRILHSAFNENETTVHYFSWSSGVGSSPENLKLVPTRIVLYALKENYEHNKSLFLGEIKWVPHGKVENHYIYHCD